LRSPRKEGSVFRIRRIYDDVLMVDRKVITQVQTILREQFPLISEKDIRHLPQVLRNPLKHRFRPILFAAEGAHNAVQGFALLLHAPTLNFAYLDYISAAKGGTGRGIGGALYERVREEALSLGVIGIFFECLPDDPGLCQVPTVIKQNADRLRFYEYYGARPIIGTAYETPIKAHDICPPYLVFDDLGRGHALARDWSASTERQPLRAISTPSSRPSRTSRCACASLATSGRQATVMSRPECRRTRRYGSS
jgi:GNAT superfamily N-acetyltransferase